MRALSGFVAAIVLGVPFGILIGRHEVLSAVVAPIASELLGTQAGLGFIILDSAQYFNIPATFIGLVLIGVIRSPVGAGAQRCSTSGVALARPIALSNLAVPLLATSPLRRQGPQSARNPVVLFDACKIGRNTFLELWWQAIDFPVVFLFHRHDPIAAEINRLTVRALLRFDKANHRAVSNAAEPLIAREPLLVFRCPS